MLYRIFGKTEWNASILGFGTMRLPVRQEGNRALVNEESAIRFIRKAVDVGIYYSDTAYGYHNGKASKLLERRFAAGTGNG